MVIWNKLGKPLTKTDAPITPETHSKKKPASAKKIAANKLNGKKSHGPIDTSKTKYNAIKHGLRAAGVSTLDSAAESDELLQQMMAEKKPVGVIETALVTRIGEQLIQLKRARRMEADYINDCIEYPEPPPLYTGIMKPRLRTQPGVTEPLVRLYQRYATTSFNTFRHSLHELERQQRMRLGEAVAAPAAVDVNVNIGSDNEKAEPENPLIEQEFPNPKKDAQH